MKKTLPIIAVTIVILGVGAWWFLGQRGGAVTMPGGIEKKAGQEGESFTGKLKQAITIGVPLKCTYQQGDFAGTGYVQGKKYFGEVSNQEQKGYVIMKDNCMWTWGEEQKQGVKMCFEEDIFEGNEEVEGTVPTEVEYHCAPAVFPDSKFDPPADINFMDVSQQFMNYGEGN